MEHVIKCANWNARGMAYREEEEDRVLGEKEFEISKSQNKNEGNENYSYKNIYTLTCSEVNNNTGAEARVKFWIYKSFKTQL
jgi:hypothetical protein